MKPLRRAIASLLHIDDTPHRTALAFGVGVWIAFSPLLGIHTGMALAIAFGFRLNRLAILLGTYINNPWTLAPLYAAGTGVGCLLLGMPLDGLGDIDWGGEDSVYQTLFAKLRPFLWPFVIGNTILGLTFGALAYFWLRGLLQRRRIARPA